MPHLRSIAALVFAIAISTVFSASTASAASPSTHVRLDGGARSYWTPQRQARAIPATTPNAGGDPRAENARTHTSYISEPVADPTALPYPANGKVFFRINRAGYYCSAAIVDAPSARLVWTAAHCLREAGRRGAWAKRWAFVPDYQTGSRPYGTWPAYELWVSGDWVTRRWSENTDFGAALIKRFGGVGVQTAVGAAYPLAVNQPVAQTWEAVGYPADPAFGDRLWHCISAHHSTDFGYSRFPGPPPMSIGCNTSGGESGGPWISQTGALGAVSTYGYVREPELLYGTYLGNAAAGLYARIQSR